VADTFLEALDEDMTNIFLNITEYAATVTITNLAGVDVSAPAQFDFQVGAVDGKERALFRVKDSVTVARNFYITFLSERWIVIDTRPDDLGMVEVRCDRPEVTA